MYTTHFDLDGRLFASGIAQDDARFVDEREEDDDALPPTIALTAPDSVLVLLGPPGIGKTTFAANALRASTGGMRSAVAWLGTPPASPHELLELLLAEFGFEPYRQSRAERVQTWRQFLIELGATETRVFVALERAHDFDAPVLAALDALTTADPNACPGASLILMGSDALASRLEEPALEPLRQRVRLVRRLRPLDAEGVQRYLAFAVERAGGRLERVFTADAVSALARHSRGIPRVLNHLAEGAVALAALRGTSCVDAALVSAVAASGRGTPIESTVIPDSAAVESAEDEPSARDEIPVLTESVDDGADAAADNDAAFDPLDAAATMTLLGDELDGLSAELAAEMLAVDGARERADDARSDDDALEGGAGGDAHTERASERVAAVPASGGRANDEVAKTADARATRDPLERAGRRGRRRSVTG